MSAIQMPRFEVRVSGQDPWELTVTNGDLVRWDMRRAAEGWPAMDQGHNLWASFICWAAARRTGKYGAQFESWIDQVEGIDFLAAQDADPTQSAAEPDSSAK